MDTVLPAPGHDHVRCAAETLSHAEAHCAARGERLTAMRRRVLEVLAASHRPLGAYEIMERVGGEHRPAPITVYRALDFLRAAGLVHRIESRNAFLACTHNHGDDPLVVFLICETCGAVDELPAGPLASALAAAAREAGFTPRLSVIEVTGTCANCRS
ncbi:Fur family transcriptional regulator [Xanthobacteraceae bacterium Astr-EGSB]|nr:Fur family transcriptional regulator [Xanthobacteraceae bacterium Astr-EGSB]